MKITVIGAFGLRAKIDVREAATVRTMLWTLGLDSDTETFHIYRSGQMIGVNDLVHDGDEIKIFVERTPGNPEGFPLDTIPGIEARHPEQRDDEVFVMNVEHTKCAFFPPEEGWRPRGFAFAYNLVLLDQHRPVFHKKAKKNGRE